MNERMNSPLRQGRLGARFQYLREFGSALAGGRQEQKTRSGEEAGFVCVEKQD
jgi:hypothetical protein